MKKDVVRDNTVILLSFTVSPAARKLSINLRLEAARENVLGKAVLSLQLNCKNEK